MPAVEVEDRRRQRIGSERLVTPHGSADSGRFAVEEPPGNVDRVAPDVHRCPTAVVGDVANVRRVEVVVGEARLDGQQLTDRPLGHELVGAQPQRVMAVHERLHHQHTRVPARIDHADNLGDVETERLLAQHVTAGRRRSPRPFRVEVVGQRDVDGLHGVVGEDVVVGTVAGGDAQAGRCGGCPVGVAGADRHDLAPLGALHSRDDLVDGDRRATEDTETDPIAHRAPSGGGTPAPAVR